MTRSPKHDERQQALSVTLAASKPFRQLAETARKALNEGVDIAQVRQRVADDAESLGLSSWRFLLPGLNRKVLRYPFPKFLIEAAKYYAKGTRHKSIYDFIESFMSKLGLDEWLVDNAVAMAKTGEPLPMLDTLFGGVHVQPLRFGDEDPVDMVMVIAGPASDFEALADDFLAACSRVFPDPESWQRSQTELRDARWARAFYDGKPDAEIAWDELAVLHPREIVHENPKFADEHRRKVQQVKQGRKRWMDRVTKMLDSSSPDSETEG